MNNTIMNLQLFAEAGNMITGTGNYVNAYTGDTYKFSATQSMVGEMKTFYDTTLLENAKPEMLYAQFAKVQPLPNNNGKTVEWRKWNTFEKANMLQEGVIPTGQRFGMSSKTGYIEQYGTYAALTDKLEMHAYDPVILGACDEMGSAAALTQETLIRDALLVNTNVLYCDNVDLASGEVVSTPTACNQMEATGEVMSMMTPMMIAKAVTLMKKNRVPTIDGKYYAVIHPSVAFDLRQDEAWLAAHQYAGVTELYSGEIGELHGVRFVETTEAKIRNEGKDGCAVYACLFLGKGAYGVVDLSEGTEVIVKPRGSSGTADPLDQRSTVGWKGIHAAAILYDEYMVRVECGSSYSGTDKAN